MSGFVHLKRRPSGIYVVRLVVPAWLRPAARQRELHRSTGCRDLALAKIVAAEMAADWHGRIARLRHMDPKKLAIGSVELLGEGLLPLAAAANLLGATLSDLADRLERRRARFFVQAKGWGGWLLPELHELDREYDILGQFTSIDLSPVGLAKHGERCRRVDVLGFRFAANSARLLPARRPLIQRRRLAASVPKKAAGTWGVRRLGLF